MRDSGTTIGGRHAYAAERVLLLIACSEWGGNKAKPGLVMTKEAIAHELGVCTDTISRAITKLHRNGLIERIARGSQSGASLPNRYRATDQGMIEASRLVRRMAAPKKAASRR